MAVRELLTHIVAQPERHAKWLNTLSFLENCGARKIAACEHPILVQEEMLKHAAEEFRHALHLKRQIYRLGLQPPVDYALSHVLGGRITWHYLPLLDIRVCRYLSKHLGLSGQRLKAAVYILVTYAIEVRAAELYRLYDEVLRSVDSKVSVKAILLEEGEHLRDMQAQVESLPGGSAHAVSACALEAKLYHSWMQALF